MILGKTQLMLTYTVNQAFKANLFGTVEINSKMYTYNEEK
jgi:hypothetical protein